MNYKQRSRINISPIQNRKLWMFIVLLSSTIIFLLVNNHQSPIHTIVTSEQIYAVAFSPDGQILAGVGTNGSIRFWRVQDALLISELAAQGVYTDIAFSPDSNYVVVGIDGRFGSIAIPGRLQQIDPSRHHTTMVWDIRRGLLVKELDCQSPTMTATFDVAFSSDGNLIVAGGDHGFICVWNTHDGSLKTKLQGHVYGGYHRDVLAVNFSHDMRFIVSGGEYGTLYVWDSDSGQLVYTLTSQAIRVFDHVSEVFFSLDDTRVIAGKMDATINVWLMRDGTLENSFRVERAPVMSMALSADGNLVAAGSGSIEEDGLIPLVTDNDTNIRIWYWKKQQLKKTLKGHTDRVVSVAFSPDGALIASGSLDGTIRIWLLK